jgi:hypothetical protein
VIGEKYGRLTVKEKSVIYTSPKGKRFQKWKCECECGNIVDVTTSALRAGHTLSCGCLQKERASASKKKYNRYVESEDITIGYTLKGEPFIIDTEDLPKIKNMCWRKSKSGYIETSCAGTILRLHRVIKPTDSVSVIDHINHNKADNRKQNLRICSHQQNLMNQAMRINNSSGYTGVTLNSGKWDAFINDNSKKIHLGRFDVKEDAIAARLNAEKSIFGEYSYSESNNTEPNKR